MRLGIAAARRGASVVPKIRDAEQLSLRDLAAALEELTTTARDGKTQPAAMVDGTFTITNVGVFGDLTRVRRSSIRVSSAIPWRSARVRECRVVNGRASCCASVLPAVVELLDRTAWWTASRVPVFLAGCRRAARARLSRSRTDAWWAGSRRPTACYSRSTMVALAMPPASHITWSP